VTEAALGPVCSEVPPGITGRKAPSFLNDVPGLALAPTQARDSPGPWSLDEDTSSCSGVDSMESEQLLSDLGDGDSDRTKRPRSSWVSTKPATNMCPWPVKEPRPCAPALSPWPVKKPHLSVEIWAQFMLRLGA
jgi:hypothetical protein